jgi:hypothetical protein
MAAFQRCLELDRAMAEKIDLSKAGGSSQRDPDEYLDPALWEHYVSARKDLVDFTTSNIEVLARSKPKNGKAEQTAEGGDDIENRLLSSLSEMADLERRLAAYLTENLEVLRRTLTALTRNQTLFTKYAKAIPKPEAERLDSKG